MAEQEEHLDVELVCQPLDRQLGMDRLGHDARAAPAALCRVRARIPGHGGSQPGDRVGTTLVDTPYGARSEEMARQARPAVLGGTPKGPLPELPIGRCLVPRAEDGIPTEFALGMDGRRIFFFVVSFEDRRCPGCTGQG